MKLEKKQEVNEAIEVVKNFYQKMDQGRAKIIASVKSISNSGMKQKISFIGIYSNDKGELYNINLTYYIALLCNYSIDKNIYALVVRGCGMDMIFSCLYSLTSFMGSKEYDRYTRYESI